MEDERVMLVTGVAEHGGERLVTVRELEGDSPYKLVEWSASEHGLRRRYIPDPMEDRRLRDQPGRWYRELPARLSRGETWTHDIPSDGSFASHTVAGWQTVRVPAGEYRALRVNIVMIEYDRQTKKPLLTMKGAFWYAPGIGEVKLECAGDSIPFRAIRELISFTPSQP